MKFVFGILIFIVILGGFYGLMLFGVLPVDQMAKSSPAMAKMLTTIHVYSPKKKKVLAAVHAPSPEVQQLATEKQQLDAEKAQLDKEKAALAAQQQQAMQAPPPPVTPAPDTGAKLISLYNKMDSDALAQIFAKLPDSQVVNALMQISEKKASDVFAALPPDRAAKISELMNKPTAAHTASTVSAPGPAASL